MTPAVIALAAVLLLAQTLLVVLVPGLRARHDAALRRADRARVLVVHRRGRRRSGRRRAVTQSS